MRQSTGGSEDVLASRVRVCARLDVILDPELAKFARLERKILSTGMAECVGAGVSV